MTHIVGRSEDKLHSLLKDYHMVVLKDSERSPKLSWCLDNCKHKFRDMSYQNERAWYFESEEDAMMFALKWS